MSEERAKSIFFDLLDIPPAEHDRYIDRVCRDDGALGERVHALIHAHISADSFMGDVDKPHTLGAPEPEAMPVPERIGAYEVERSIGEGGFGSVYLCRQREPIERLVAVKVLRPGVGSGTALRRFEEERVLLSRMDHPGIARVLDAGRDPAVGSFIAMEYVEGDSITAYCDWHRLTLRDRLALMVQACKAVQHAHQKGVIHRDLKPSNVLVSSVDGRPVVKVIDFGVSKAFGGADEGDDAITRTMQLVGTPQYMSPEQASADAAGMDTRSDVYSLGVMLYELATGQQPFDTKKMRSASASQLERMIREVEPPRPSTRVERLDAGGASRLGESQSSGVGQIVRSLRGEADWIVTKAMSKDRERRYPSAYAFGEDLERVLRGEPAEARPPNAAYTLRKLVARNKAVAGVFAVVVLCLVAVAGISVGYANRIGRANTEIRATLDAQERVLGFAQGMLEGIDPAVAREKDTELLRVMLESARDRVTPELDESPAVGVRVRMMIGVLYWNIGEYEPAEELFEQALALGESSAEVDATALLEVYAGLGAIYSDLSRHGEARDVLEPAVELGRAELGHDHPGVLVAISNLGVVYGNLGEHDRAAEMFETLLAARVRVLGDEHEDTMATRNSLANALKSTGEIERAEALFRLVLDHQLVNLGHDHPNTLKTRTNLAGIYADLERIGEAVEMNTEILEQKRRVLGHEHPSVLVSMANLASVLEKHGDVDSAQGLFEDAYGISDGTLGAGHQYTLMLQNNLAALLVRRGDYETALPHQRAAHEGLAVLLGEEHPIAVQCAGNYAQALLKVDRPAEALLIARATVGIGRRVHVPANEKLADLLQTLAMCHAAVGEAALAERLAGEAAGIILDARGADSPEYQKALTLLEG